MRITINQLAKDECANWEKEKCLNIDILPDGSLAHLFSKPPTRCVIMDGKPCKYFEECCVPLAESERDPTRKKALEQTVFEYRLKFGTGSDKKKCPQCGDIIDAKRSLCRVCASQDASRIT